jgi:hypothetical protein
VIDTPARVLFVALTSSGEWQQISLEPSAGTPPASPTWREDTIGRCQPQVVVPAGVSRAQLWLDPARSPSPGDRTVRLLIVEMACASGQSPAGRIVEPQLVYRPSGVFVSLTIQNRPGAQDCQGNPEYQYTLQLSEPLGSRQLFDANLVPPVPVGAPPRP